MKKIIRTERTKNDGEAWYLAAVFLASLVLSLLSMPALRLSWNLIAQFGFTFLLHLFLVYVLYALPHLPAYVYGVYIRESQTSTVPGYPLALVASILIYVNLSVTLLFIGRPPAPPVGYHEVIIVVFILLFPTYHAYIEYDDHGDFIQVVLLFIVYAPWAQFVRFFIGYTQFV